MTGRMVRGGRSARRLAAVAAVAAGVVAGCGGDDADDAGPDDEQVTTTTTPDGTTTTAVDDGDVDATTTTAAAGGGALSGLAPDDLCAFVDDATLADAFAGGAPEPEANDYGAGFVECVYGDEDADAEVRLSVVPVAEFRSDFLDQLSVVAPVEGLDEGTAFPGVVGIGRVSGGGGSVGAVAGDEALVVAFRVGEGDQSADLRRAEALVRRILLD